MKVIQVWLQLFRNYITIIENKFSNTNFYIHKYNTRICSAYLKLHNLSVPKKFPDKCKAVMNYKETNSY